MTGYEKYSTEKLYMLVEAETNAYTTARIAAADYQKTGQKEKAVAAGNAAQFHNDKIRNIMLVILGR